MGRKFYIFISFWLASMVSVYAQFQLNIFGGEIIESYGLTNTQFALLFTSPMIPAILLSLIIGKLSDRIGGKKVVGICLILTVIGLVLRIYADSYILLLLTMMLTGFGAIGVTVNVANILKNIFSVNRISLGIGIFTTGAMLAQFIATSTSAIFFSSINEAFIVAAILGILITIIWWIGIFLFKEEDIEEDKEVEEVKEKKGVNKGVLLVGLCIMINMGVIITFNTFLPIALEGENLFSKSQIGISAAMISLGNLVGAVLGPIIYSKLKSIKKFLIIFGTLGGILSIFTWRLYPVALLIIGIFITGLVLGSMMPIYFSAPIYLKGVSKNSISSASGLITTLQLIGAVAIPTYIISPIVKGNFNLMFLIAGLLMLIIPFLGVIINKKMKVQY